MAVGCHAAASDLPAREPTKGAPFATATAIAIGPGSALASVVVEDGTFDAPRDWVSELPDVFPTRAVELSEAWGFDTEFQCRDAHYERDIGALQAKHPKWAELASLFAQAPEQLSANTTDGAAKLFAQRMFTSGEAAMVEVTFSVCTPLVGADRVAIATAQLRRIPTLREHDAVVSHGYVTAVVYTRSSKSATETSVSMWMVGDAGARHAWQTFLEDNGFAKGETLESTSALRSYSITPQAGEYKLEVKGHLE